jgi:hypothetical protein
MVLLAASAKIGRTSAIKPYLTLPSDDSGDWFSSALDTEYRIFKIRSIRFYYTHIILLPKSIFCTYFSLL